MTFGDWFGIVGGLLLIAFIVLGFWKATKVPPGEQTNDWDKGYWRGAHDPNREPNDHA